jgi:hypothetical protein
MKKKYDIIDFIQWDIRVNYSQGETDKIMKPFMWLRGLSSDLQSNIFHLLEVAHAAGGLTTHFYRRSRHLPPGRIAPPKRKQKQPEWIGEALLLAKAYVSNNKQYSQAKLATHIRAELGDRAPDNRRIVIVVSGWQKNGLIPRPL